MMNEISFFRWYLSRGLSESVLLWRRYFFFFGRFFSIGNLFLHLLSPWKKDIEMKTWVGLSPSRSLKRLINNLFSRLAGSIVRSSVILIGTFILVSWIIFGMIFFVFWLLFPIIIFSAGVLSFKDPLWGMALWTSGAFFVALVIFGYRNSRQEELSGLPAGEAIKNNDIRRRVANRLGMEADKLPIEIFSNRSLRQEFLQPLGISEEEIGKILSWECREADRKYLLRAFWREENLDRTSPIGSTWNFGYTVNLDRYSLDLSRWDPTEYKDAELVGHREELELLKVILKRPDQNSVLLVGPSGIGKNTLVHNLAKLIRRNEIEEELRNLRILVLDLGRAVSDAVNRGLDVENSLRSLFYEAAYAGNVILVIENLEKFLSDENHSEVASVLGEYLENPTFQLIATSTTGEYHRLIEMKQGMIKYLEVIEMRECTEEESVEALLVKLRPVEKLRPVFTWKGLLATVKESGRFNWDFPLPERAIDLAMNTLTFWESGPSEYFLSPKTISKFLSMKTGMPQGEIEKEEKDKLLNLEAVLHEQVIGQDEAIRQVAEVLRRLRSGIANSKKPLGSFLFLGPTGVGKTETAKALAKAYFGSEEKMIRLDMSEYQNPNSLDRLLGSKELDQKGILSTKVKDNPYSILLLDEIEKSYPGVLDLFLQILDEGFLTDAFGDKINFRNILIIATSNAGSQKIKELVENGSSPEETKKSVIDFVIENNVFRVEFLNRWEGVVFFKPLTREELIQVTGLLLEKVARRIKEEKNIRLSFDVSLAEGVVDNGYDPIFGARSIDRFIKDSIEDILARKIIAGEINPGEEITLTAADLGQSS